MPSAIITNAIVGIFISTQLLLSFNTSANDTSSTPILDIDESVQSARAYIDQEKYETAIRTLNLVIAEKPDNADAWNLLGYSWRNLDDKKQSRKAYARALDINPDHKGALEYQGELYLLMGDIDAAKKNYDHLMKLCPDGCEELADLAKALKKFGS